MSQKVRVECHPSSDAQFHRHLGAHLTIELPDSYGPQDAVAEVERRLRETYPQACIRVETGAEVIWHVYRDGEPGTSLS